MNKLVLLFALLAFTASAKSLRSSNYTFLHEFVQGFMNGFEGRSYDLSDECLSESFQTTLDEDLVQVLYSLVRGKLSEAATHFEDFMKLLGTQNEKCGLNQIAESITYLVENDSVFTLFRNIVTNSFDIVAQIIDSIGAMTILEAQNAGNHLGKAMALVVPPKP